MELRLIRQHFTEKSTTGSLYVDGFFECYTLEDVAIDWSEETKIAGETAIPCGIYQVVINLSQRFKEIMPLLVAVPHFEGIRIHPGNTDKDTHGCILVGKRWTEDKLIESRAAYNELLEKLRDAESITIEIVETK